MKTTIRITWIAFILLLCQACSEDKAPLTKEGEIISRLQHDKSQSDNYRKAAGILLGIFQENEGIKIRDYLNAEREFSLVRNMATAQAWITLMEAIEEKLPDTLPSAEEMELEAKRNNKNKIDVIHYSLTMRLDLINSCISALSYMDMPEAKSAMDSLFQRFERKYGSSSGGKKILEKYRIQRRQHEEDTRRGLAPWQVDPNTGDGVSQNLQHIPNTATQHVGDFWTSCALVCCIPPLIGHTC